MRWIISIASLSLFFGGLVIGCSTSSGSDSANADAGCSSPAGSCDGPSPIFYQVDLADNCVLPAQVTLSDICSTTVNRCAPSGGIGPACAFSPDGGVYVQTQSDNNMYSASGWHFDQPYGGFPDPGPLPADQHASDAQQTQCVQVQCWPACSGPPIGYGLGGSCPIDGGHD
jgi:hypothetical protein